MRLKECFIKYIKVLLVDFADLDYIEIHLFAHFQPLAVHQSMDVTDLKKLKVSCFIIPFVTLAKYERQPSTE